MVMWIVIGVVVACALAEWLHARRVRRVAYLAFGPRQRPTWWVRPAGLVRVAAVGLLAWGLLTLLSLDAGVWQSETSVGVAPEQKRHLVVALDVSPSMELIDAGPDGKQSRGQRAREVLRSILDRTDLKHTGVTLIAFYNESRPVFIDTFDANVVANVLDDLPVEHAYAPGKTDIYAAVASAAEVAREWPRGSATLVVVSDGDTLPNTDRPELPAAFREVLVLGAGDRYQGKYIDGHTSRQDARSLERLALQLDGTYFDANQKHVPTTELGGLTSVPLQAGGAEFGTREAALAAVGLGALLLSLISPLLAALGGTWNSQRARPREAYRLTAHTAASPE